MPKPEKPVKNEKVLLKKKQIVKKNVVKKTVKLKSNSSFKESKNPVKLAKNIDFKENQTSSNLVNLYQQNKYLITIFLLIVLPPIGLICMFAFRIWNLTVRLLLTTAIFLLIVAGLVWLSSSKFIFQNSTSDNLNSKTVETTLVLAKTTPYSFQEKISANGLEFTVTEFKVYLAEDNLNLEKINYCALTFVLKNTSQMSYLLSEKQFLLLDSKNQTLEYLDLTRYNLLSFPKLNFLTNNGQLQNLNPGEEKTYFTAYKCQPEVKNYTLQNQINRFASQFVASGNFQPILVALSL